MHTPENGTRSLFTLLDVLQMDAALTVFEPSCSAQFNKGNGVLALIRFVTVGLLEPQR